MVGGTAIGTAETELPVRYAVGGILYRHGAGGVTEIVLIKKRHGFWTLPKGHIKAGELANAALLRELREETGLSGVVESFIYTLNYPITRRGRDYTKVVHYYLVGAVSGTPRPCKRERIQSVRWFPFPEALRRVVNPRVYAVLEQAAPLLPGVVAPQDVSD
ncbi:MAG: NUDIX domain-containing protein [Chloroflexaceae bacterium]|jgi:8-oxo-dGTP pyrophosphatase MutT (NUDIX family)|nr:NUDIX domain-containing protein [Chloroflexaceae bacterium]